MLPTQTRNTKGICALTAGLLTLYLIYSYDHHLFLLLKQPEPVADLLYGLDYSHVNWSHYAYSQYATDEEYLCNSVMVFEALHRLGSKPDRVLMYPKSWNTAKHQGDRKKRLLEFARDKYGAKLTPIKMSSAGCDRTWSMSANKLKAFELTQYERVLHLDSDTTVLQPLDDLFFLPSTPVAMPRAYWLSEEKGSNFLTSLIVLLEPSRVKEHELLDTAHHMGLYDMDTLNIFFGATAMVLPHRNFALLTGEFRSTNHTLYLGSAHETWDPDTVIREARLVHFSDWPLPKPWIVCSDCQMEKLQPACDSGTDEHGSCRDREIWWALYQDFRRRRRELCEDAFNQSTGKCPPEDHPFLLSENRRSDDWGSCKLLKF